MKDWEAACDELRGQLKAMKENRDYYRKLWEDRVFRDQQISDRLKELLIEALGR